MHFVGSRPRFGIPAVLQAFETVLGLGAGQAVFENTNGSFPAESGFWQSAEGQPVFIRVGQAGDASKEQPVCGVSLTKDAADGMSIACAPDKLVHDAHFTSNGCDGGIVTEHPSLISGKINHTGDTGSCGANCNIEARGGTEA